jgi:hypothetical protein
MKKLILPVCLSMLLFTACGGDEEEKDGDDKKSLSICACMDEANKGDEADADTMKECEAMAKDMDKDKLMEELEKCGK